MLATPAYFVQEPATAIHATQKGWYFIHPGTGCNSLSRASGDWLLLHQQQYCRYFNVIYTAFNGKHENLVIINFAQ